MEECKYYLCGNILEPINTQCIHPRGWLERELETQRSGLSGHVHKFWGDIKDSEWQPPERRGGGEQKGESWERVPYWLDGVLPLAVVTKDEELLGEVKKVIKWVVESQGEDGWIGPMLGLSKTPTLLSLGEVDLWPQFLILKVLVQYSDIFHQGEGMGGVGDMGDMGDRIVVCVSKGINMVREYVGRGLFEWGKYRWFEALIPIFWLYNITGDHSLLLLSKDLEHLGFDYPEYYSSRAIESRTVTGEWSLDSHVVNNTMALKAHALLSRIKCKGECEGECIGSQGSKRYNAGMQDILYKHHGSLTGIPTGDECLGGRNPIQGTELCGIMEYLYSMEVCLGSLGHTKYISHLEECAFNSLPAIFSPSMWSHQYVQQTNQIAASINSSPPWTTNGPHANIFGVQPNFGCCLANMHQGWPKFLSSVVMTKLDNVAERLVVAVFAPITIRREIGGTMVQLEIDTQYPFRGHVRIAITITSTLPNMKLGIYLHEAEWVRRYGKKSLGINVGRNEMRMMNVNGEFEICEEASREWILVEGAYSNKERHIIEVEIPLVPRIRYMGYENSISIHRGPLVFALCMKEEWREIDKREYWEYKEYVKEHPQMGDWEVLPLSPWNYALAISKHDYLSFIQGGNEVEINHTSITFDEVEDCKELPVFERENPKVICRMRGRRVKNWVEEKGSHSQLPSSPISLEHLAQEEEILQLIPYACTNLRIAQFPFYIY